MVGVNQGDQIGHIFTNIFVKNGTFEEKHVWQLTIWAIFAKIGLYFYS